MAVSLTQLRANLYKIVDQVIETGEPIEIIRHGVKVTLSTTQKKKKLSRLVKRKSVINGDPEDLVHIDWSHEWKGKKMR